MKDSTPTTRQRKAPQGGSGLTSSQLESMFYNSKENEKEEQRSNISTDSYLAAKYREALQKRLKPKTPLSVVSISSNPFTV